MLESLFNKVTGLQTCSVNKKKLQNSCFPVNIAKSLRTPISKIICKRLLLPLEVFCISSGGCNPVNWLSQTTRNLIIEYLNLNFVTTPKLTPLHSIHFMRKRFLFLFFNIFIYKIFANRFFKSYIAIAKYELTCSIIKNSEFYKCSVKKI